MFTKLSEIIQIVYARIVASVFGGGWTQLAHLILSYRALDDEQLREQYALESVKLRDASRLWVVRFLQRYRNSPEAAVMAISVVVFERHPADLPPGTAPYPEQVLAAQHLVDGQNVELATGEGKTYAIALAIPTLVARHGQVMVMTVNDYLAHRDRQRVEPFLRALGIEVAEGIQPPEFVGAAYLRMRDAAFRYLDVAYLGPSSSRPAYPFEAAVVIDEIDSVLIDDQVTFSQTDHLSVREDGWPAVAGLVATWREGEHFVHDRLLDEVELTPTGWLDLQRMAAAEAIPGQRAQEMAGAVVWSLTAEEDRDFVRDGRALMLVDPTTGALSTQDSALRVKALRFRLTGEAPWISVPYADISRLDLLARHPHVVGVSGTCASDFFFYHLALGTWTVSLRPRFPRDAQVSPTRFFTSRQGTLAAILKGIGERQPSPTIVMTWSVPEAQQTYAYLRSALPDTRVEVMTSFDSESDDRIVLGAGEEGVVTVLANGGCRGVDIRSTHRPHLAVLGHASETRLDRQILGRVGRHGEQFTAEFFEDPHTPLVRNNPGIRNPLLATGRLTGEDKEMRVVTLRNSFKKMQQQVSRVTRVRRVLAGALSQSAQEAEETLREMFSQWRRAKTAEDLADYVASIPGTPEMHAQVLTALERRTEQDLPASRLITALQAIENRSTGELRLKIVPPRDGATDEARLAEVEEWVGDVEQAESGPDREMMLSQLRTMTRLGYRLPSSPAERTPADVVYGVLKAAGASHRRDRDRERSSIAVNAYGPDYYRKCAIVYTNLAAQTRERLGQTVLQSLADIDHPQRLGHLFPKTEIYPAAPKKAAAKPSTSAIAPTTAASTAWDEEVIDRVVAQVVEICGPDLFGRGPSERELLLHLRRFLRGLEHRAGFMTRAQLNQELGRMLDVQVAQGYRLRDCRVFYRASAMVVNALADEGLVGLRVNERPTARRDYIRAKLALVRTVSPMYWVAILGFLALAGAGLLVPVPVAPAWLRPVGDMLGLGGLVASGGSMAAAVLGVLVLIGTFAQATGRLDRQVFTLLVGPPLAAVGVTILAIGQIGVLLGLALGVGVFLWTRALLLLQRMILVGTAADALIVLACLSVVQYAAVHILHGDLLAVVAVAVPLGYAILCGSLFFTVSVGRAELMDAGGALRYVQTTSAMQVWIDPLARSALLGLILGMVLVPWTGNSGAVVLLMQSLCLGWLIVSRTALAASQARLARRGFAQLGDDASTRSELRTRRRRMLWCLIPLALGMSVAVAFLGVAPYQLAVAEVAGMVLLAGRREVVSLLGGASSSFAADDTSTGRERRQAFVKELRKLGRRPAGKVGIVVVVVVAIWNVLSFFSDVWSLPELFTAVAKWLLPA